MEIVGKKAHCSLLVILITYDYVGRRVLVPHLSAAILSLMKFFKKKSIEFDNRESQCFSFFTDPT